jgi:predicted transcriptional regulator
MRKGATARRTTARATTAKKKVIAAVEKLPRNATIEDAIERLVLMAKIDRGLAEVDGGKGVDHSEAKRRLLR